MAEQSKPAVSSTPAAAAGAPAKEKKRFKEKEEKKAPEANKELENEILVRIMGYDIPGSKKIYAGLTRIKGISWAISNFVTKKLGIPIGKKIQELSKDEIKKIEEFLRKLPIFDFFKNRRNDRETGISSHLYGVDLDLKRDFDIKRMRTIKSYKGIRYICRLLTIL
jgi:small subunit ribosomal protein S13